MKGSKSGKEAFSFLGNRSIIIKHWNHPIQPRVLIIELAQNGKSSHRLNRNNIINQNCLETTARIIWIHKKQGNIVYFYSFTPLISTNFWQKKPNNTNFFQIIISDLFLIFI